MFDKIDVRLIVRRHYLTLYDNRSGRASWRDHALFIGGPLSVAGAATIVGVRLGSTSALLTGVAALAAFLFALLILVLQMSADTATVAEDAGISNRLLRRVRILRETAANVAYSVIVAIVGTVWLAVGEFLLPAAVTPAPGEIAKEPRQSLWYSAIAVAILTHLVLTLLMVVKRTFAIADRELDHASVPVGRS